MLFEFFSDHLMRGIGIQYIEWRIPLIILMCFVYHGLHALKLLWLQMLRFEQFSLNTEPKHKLYFIEIRISDKCSFFSLFSYLVEQWICMVIRINSSFRRHYYFFICFIRDDIFPTAHIIEQNKTRTFDGKLSVSDAKGCCVSSLNTATSNSFVFSQKLWTHSAWSSSAEARHPSLYACTSTLAQLYSVLHFWFRFWIIFTFLSDIMNCWNCHSYKLSKNKVEQ